MSTASQQGKPWFRGEEKVDILIKTNIAEEVDYLFEGGCQSKNIGSDPNVGLSSQQGKFCITERDKNIATL